MTPSSPTTPGQTRLSVASAAMLAAAVVLCRVMAIHSFPIYDDAFITYRYAQNLAAGHGLVYNPGAAWEPVLGTTTPAYAVLLAGLVWLGADVIGASLAFNVLCDALSALLILRLLGGRAVAATVAIAVFAALPEISRICVGGMEAPLLLLAMLAATAAERARRPMLAGAFAALCCLVRPESLFLVLALAWRLRRDRGALVRYATPVAAIGLAAVATLWSIYGQPIPQSVVAKARRTDVDWRERLSEIKFVLVHAFGPNRAVQLLAPIAAIGYLRGLSGASKLQPVFFQAVAMVVAYSIAGSKTWGWYYYVPLVAWACAFGLGVESVVERVARLRALNRLPGATRAFASTMAVVAILVMAVFAWNWSDRVTQRIYRPMARWFAAANLGERKASILASDIGAVGYFASGARILDSEGLVWPDALRFNHQVEVLKAYMPDYAVWVVNDYRLGRFNGEPELLRCYRPVMRFNATGESDLAPDPSQIHWWEQDYIVFERVSPPMAGS